MTEHRKPAEPSESTWEAQISEYWDTVDLDDHGAAIARMRQLVTVHGIQTAAALFEMASVYDATGFEPAAATAYEAARSAGLSGPRLRRLEIQYASTLRNLGRSAEAVQILQAAEPDPSLGDALTVFLALALHDVGRSAEALRLTIDALIPHLPRYQRAASEYSRALVEPAVEL